MKLEEHFSQTLHQAVANEPPATRAWETFERRARRHRRVRFAMSLTTAAAMITLAAVAIPRVWPGGRVVTPILESPSTDPYAGWSTFIGSLQSLRIKHPPEWRVIEIERAYRFSWELLPPGYPQTSTGSRTFAVTIASSLADSRAIDDPDAVKGAPERGTTPDGRPFVRFVESPADGSRTVVYRIDRRPPCAFQDPQCDIGYMTLVVRILASDSALWDEFGATAESIVRSVE